MPETEELRVSVREQVDFLQRVLRKRWWLIAVLTVVAGAAAFGTAKLMRPVYEASTSVRILREPSVTATTQGSAERGTLRAESTWFTSRLIVEDVVRRLALAESPSGSLLDAGMEKAKNTVRRLLNRPVREGSRTNEVVNQLQTKSIHVKELGGNVLEIRVNWHDPEMTMRIANTLVDVFIEKYQEFSRGRTRQNRVNLEQQVQLAAAQLQLSEKNLVDFQKKTGLVYPDEKQVGLPAQSELQRLMVEMRQAELEKTSARSQLDQIEQRLETPDTGAQRSQEGSKALRAALSNPTSLLRTLMSQAVGKEIDAARDSRTYTKDNPIGGRTLRELEGLKNQLGEELKRLGADPTLGTDVLLSMAREEEQGAGVSQTMSAQLEIERAGLEGRIKVYEDQLTSLQGEIQKAEKETKGLPEDLQRYMSLARDKRVNEDLYTVLCQRLAGAQVDEHSDLCDIRVFDLAQLPVAPLKPKPVMLTLLGTFMGLLLGISVALSIEYLDDSLHTSQDVQVYLGLPVLAEIPKVKVNMRKRLTPAGNRPELVGPA